MGRYRSSPQCGHCWEQGHTKRGCPTYRAKAEKWLAENPDVKNSYDKPWWVRDYSRYDSQKFSIIETLNINQITDFHSNSK